MSIADVSYTVDEQDLLIAATTGYFAYARENHWDDAESSIGRSLWDFVSGMTMVRVQRTLLHRVRETGRLVELPFRCDSPTIRREMTIGIEAQEDGGVRFAPRVRFEQTRPHQRLLDSAEQRGSDLIEMCGWCDRFFVGDRWLEIEDAAAELNLTARDDLPEISHGICVRCSEMLLTA